MARAFIDEFLAENNVAFSQKVPSSGNVSKLKRRMKSQSVAKSPKKTRGRRVRYHRALNGKREGIMGDENGLREKLLVCVQR